VTTQIIDVETGEMIESKMDFINGTPQSVGSAVTYYRRYTLQSLLSLQAVDDDGEKASQPVQQPVQKPSIGEKAFNQAIEKIVGGDKTVYKKVIDAYLLTPQQAIELEEVFNS
jgi:hypothetical protein